jgi:glyoxylase-like metal-dependent hydrolase (beta-lactamase superfamily II)
MSDHAEVQIAPAEAAAALARAEAEGIKRLAISTPFVVGRVNTYLIEDDPLTLIDSGPNSGTSLDELEQELAAHGHAVEDIELIIATHQHIDHIGLIDIVARRSGAEVAALESLAGYLDRYGTENERDDEFSEAIMLRHGIPSDVIYALRSVSRSFRAWGDRATVTRPFADGDEISLRDRTLTALHRPGHSPTDTVFWDAERHILIAGDHLIGHVSSNPLISRPVHAEPERDDDPVAARPPALLIYLESLAKTRELPAELVLPGHGDPVTDHAALIDARFRMHERRAEKIHGLIAQEPRTAYEIGHALWGNVAVTQAYLVLSEVLGHIDMLVRDGLVRELDDHAVARFVAS